MINIKNYPTWNLIDDENNPLLLPDFVTMLQENGWECLDYINETLTFTMQFHLPHSKTKSGCYLYARAIIERANENWGVSWIEIPIVSPHKHAQCDTDYFKNKGIAECCVTQFFIEDCMYLIDIVEQNLLNIGVCFDSNDYDFKGPNAENKKKQNAELREKYNIDAIFNKYQDIKNKKME